MLSREGFCKALRMIRDQESIDEQFSKALNLVGNTRFIHSLGVMHIADKIAISLGLTCQDRKIVRLAGLLHDIGHYPLSHVCEAPYKKPILLVFPK